MTILQPSDEGIFFDIVPEPEGNNRIYVNFYNAGTFSIEVSIEELEKLYGQLGLFLGGTHSSQQSGRSVVNIHPCNGCGCILDDNLGCPEMKTCLDYHICKVAQITQDKVLDAFDKMIMKRTDELLKEFYECCCDKLVWERRLGVGEVLDMIKEFQRGKKGEQE